MRRALLLCLLLLVVRMPVASADPVIEPWIAVVVAGTQMDDGIDAEAVSLIFKRKKQLWPDGRRILPVNLPADHPLRRRFSRAVLGLAPEALEDYWNEQYFHGVTPPHVLASEAAVSRFVASTRGAVGYLSYCAVDAAQLKVLLLIDAQGRLVSAPEAAPTACPSISGDD